MLTKLTLKNIKSYKNESALHIAPITLIYGKNSSGKSSLWKFIEVIRQTLHSARPTNFFLNLDNPIDFSNRSTLTFINKENSSFGLEFAKDDLLQFAKSGNKDWDPLKKNSFLNFQFCFKNPSKKRKENIYKIFEELEKMKQEMRSVEDIEEDQKSYFDKLLNEPENKLKEDRQRQSSQMKTLLHMQYSKIKDKMNNLNKQISDIQLYSKVSEKDNDLNNSDDLFELNLKQNNKLFAKYKIIKIPNLYDSQIPNFLQKKPEEATDDSMKGIIKKFNEKLSKKPYVRFEQYVMGALKKEMGDKFEYEVTREVKDIRGKSSKKITYDAYGPLGPLNIKYSKNRPPNYLFFPIEISNDTSFWKGHFEMMQIAKEVMENKNLDEKSEKFIMKNISHYFWNEHQSFEHAYDIDAGSIPGVDEVYNRTLKVLSTNSLEEFSKIMTEELKYTILRGKDFHPDNFFYGGDVLSLIFGWMFGLIQESIQYIDAEELLGPESIPIVNDEKIQTKFTKAYFSFRSFHDQIRTVFNLQKNFFDNIINAHLNRPDITKLLSFVEKKMNDDRNIASIISDVLEKIQLPFKFKFENSPIGKIHLSFINPKISGSDEKNISFYESGSGLTNLIPLVYFCIKNKRSTIIVEEPENKLHPSIQGNVVEFLCDVNKNYHNNFIIETHSEHFILRLQKLVRDKKIDKDLVAINYVYLDDAGEGSKVDHMQLDENGKFLNKWRHGFFSERLEEI